MSFVDHMLKGLEELDKEIKTQVQNVQNQASGAKAEIKTFLDNIKAQAQSKIDSIDKVIEDRHLKQDAKIDAVGTSITQLEQRLKNEVIKQQEEYKKVTNAALVEIKQIAEKLRQNIRDAAKVLNRE